MIEFILILEELSKKYPNNTDLGGKVRILVNSDTFQNELKKIKEEKGRAN